MLGCIVLNWMEVLYFCGSSDGFLGKLLVKEVRNYISLLLMLV